MARDLGELNREDFARYKDDVKKEGKPFFPRAIYHDTVMSLVVVVRDRGARGDLVLRRGRRRSRGSSGRGTRSPPIPGRRTSSRGRTGTSTSSSTSCGSSSGRRRSSSPRSASRRSASSSSSGSRSTTAGASGGRCTARSRWSPPFSRPVDGGAHVEGRDREGGARLRARRSSFPQWAEEQGFTGNEEAGSGATLFAQSGCLNCHTYLGQGDGNLGAPDLSAIGAVRTTPPTSSST